jgi:hypothetical protein
MSYTIVTEGDNDEIINVRAVIDLRTQQNELLDLIAGLEKRLQYPRPPKTAAEGAERSMQGQQLL